MRSANSKESPSSLKSAFTFSEGTQEWGSKIMLPLLIPGICAKKNENRQIGNMERKMLRPLRKYFPNGTKAQAAIKPASIVSKIKDFGIFSKIVKN